MSDNKPDVTVNTVSDNIQFFPSISVRGATGNVRIPLELSGVKDADLTVLRAYARRPPSGGYFGMTAFVEPEDRDRAVEKATEIVDTVFASDDIAMTVQVVEPKREGQSYIVSISPQREERRQGFSL
jgi:hypothetical protein